MRQASFPLSSNVRSASYDDDTGELTVEFKNGSYVYRNVPADVFDGMASAPSVGAYVNSMIVGQYDFAKS